MSQRFDVLISCSLRLGTPQHVIDAIRYLTDPTYELEESKRQPMLYSWHVEDTGENGELNLWEVLADKRLLKHDPEHMQISLFRVWHPYDSGVHAEELQGSLQFSVRGVIDEDAALLPLILSWLATYSYDGLVGCYTEQTYGGLYIVYAKDGKPVEHFSRAPDV